MTTRTIPKTPGFGTDGTVLSRIVSRIDDLSKEFPNGQGPQVSGILLDGRTG
jgi:hypothetical protein